MITDRDIRDQIATAIQEQGEDFDVDGIVAEIQQTYGLVDIDTIPSAEFWAIVERHDQGADYGILTDYTTGEAIRPATEAERDASRAAGGPGVFRVDRGGEICSADADPAVYGPTRDVFVAE